MRHVAAGDRTHLKSQLCPYWAYELKFDLKSEGAGLLLQGFDLLEQQRASWRCVPGDATAAAHGATAAPVGDSQMLCWCTNEYHVHV